MYRKNGADALPYPISPTRNYIDRTPTFRVNLDQTVTPTFLVHLGLGEVRYDHIDSSPASVLTYDAVQQLGLVGSGTTPSGFPRLTGLSSSQGGVASANNPGVLGPINANNYYNDKPTIVWSGMLVAEATPINPVASGVGISGKTSTRAAHRAFTISALTRLAFPICKAAPLGGGTVGFPYASFLLGLANDASTRISKIPNSGKPLLACMCKTLGR